LNVFKVRDKLVGNYYCYVSSFIRIRDERIREYVERRRHRVRWLG
jgi:hypothetical protein